jgi:hypothetical protein
MASWTEVTITPGVEAIAQLRQSWEWLLGASWRPLLFSAVGDVFLQRQAGTVWWLGTATGSLEQVAESEAEFVALLEGEHVNEWFMPSLVEALKSAGKQLSPGQCYSYTTLPVFNEGSFSVENMYPLSAKEHFSFTGHVIKQIQTLSDGTPVSFKIEE